MIPANDNRCLEFTVSHHLVERKTKPVTLPQTDPANTCRQALKMDALTRRIQPGVKMLVIRDEFFDFRIGLVDILGVTRQRNPAKRPDTAAKQRSYVRWHEAWKIEFRPRETRALPAREPPSIFLPPLRLHPDR